MRWNHILNEIAAVESLKIGKAPGIDGISAEMKNNPEETAEYFTYLSKLSVNRIKYLKNKKEYL